MDTLPIHEDPKKMGSTLASPLGSIKLLEPRTKEIINEELFIPHGKNAISVNRFCGCSTICKCFKEANLVQAIQ
jgi:hypothetical protein